VKNYINLFGIRLTHFIYTYSDFNLINASKKKTIEKTLIRLWAKIKFELNQKTKQKLLDNNRDLYMAIIISM